MTRYLGLLIFVCWCSAATMAQALPQPETHGDVTMRFVEFGDFSISSLQGAEIELVNSGPQDKLCSVTLILKRKNMESGAITETARSQATDFTLAAHTRRGFRVAEKLVYGDCWLALTVTMDGTPWLTKKWTFTGNGPYTVTLRPAFLGSNGIYITVESLNHEPARFRFQLLDATGKKVLFETSNFRQIIEQKPEQGETTPLRYRSFISFKNQPPGKYVIQMQAFASNSNQTIARSQLPVAMNPI